MKLNLLAVGDHMPSWVDAACAEYQKRFPPEIRISVTAIPAQKRGRNPVAAMRAEEKALLGLISPRAHLVALDEHGREYTSRELAAWMERTFINYPEVTFLIGGPEGLTDALRERADEFISLSRLTFPHPLARVVLIETLYRAHTILRGLPYHRD